MSALAGGQLPLALGFRPALGREDFLVGASNQDAVAWLDLWPDWPAPALIVHGPAGCGKTHLAEVWRARSNAVRLADDIASVPAVGGASAMVVEDVERRLASPTEERALLHIYNVAKEQGHHLLLTSREPAIRWGLALPDLRSRLLALPAVAIGPPDDALIGAVLVKQFADRQVRVSPEVVNYVLARIERSFAAVRRIAAALDAAALAEQRAITTALAREVLRKEGFGA